MNKGELITALSEMGIERLYGSTLSGLKKKEMEVAFRAIKKGAPRHLSHSQVSTYRKCSMQYYYRYKEKIKSPPGFALTLGSVMDHTENHNYSQKIKSGNDEPLGVLEDVFHEEFEARRDETDWAENDPNVIETTGRSLVRVYTEDLAPVTYPIAVQKEYDIAFSNAPYTFKAFIDLIAVDESDTIIIDNKTSGKTPSQPMVDNMAQLTAYASVWSMIDGRPDGGLPPVGIDALVSTKTPKAVQLRSTRTYEQIQRYWKTVQRVWELIRDGAFVTVEADNWVCNPKWCGYYGICHEEF